MPYHLMKRSVGLLMLTLVIAIALFFLLILREKKVFEPRYSFYFTTQSANSFTVGMPVKFSGFDVGIIDQIELQEDGKVRMTFSIGEENRKWINAGSNLVIKKPLIGTAHIVLNSSLNGSPPLAPEASLPIEISDDINDLIDKLEPVVKKATTIVDNVEKITNYLVKDDSQLVQILENLNSFSKKIADSDSLMTSLTGDKNATESFIKALNQTAEISTEILKISREIEQITASLDKKIVNPSSETIKELNAIMKDVRRKLKILDGTVREIGAYQNDFVVLKEQISVGIQKSNQIIDKVDGLMQSKTDKEVQLP